MGFTDKLLEILTKLFLRYQGFKLKKKIIYTYEEYSKQIFIFEADPEKYKKIGQATPFGTIIMPEFTSTKYTKNVVDYVFLHELGHTRVNIILRTLFYVVFVGSFTVSVISMCYFIESLILLHIPERNIFFLCSFTIFFILTMLSSWIYELVADLFAYNVLGKKLYVDMKIELDEKKGQVRLRDIIRHAFLYPPKPIFWYFVHKIDNKKRA